MGDLFKALSSGLAQFVYAWILPSAITCGLFSVIVLAHLSPPPFADVNVWVGGGLFILATVTLSVVFAYSSRSIYRLLEGYTIPAFLRERMRKRQRRTFHRLSLLRLHGPPLVRQESAERLKEFPESPLLIMPTRMGNALKAMEQYGVTRFGLDSQTFWYELQSAAPEAIRGSTRETRSAVDFFVSSLAHLSLLGVACLAFVPVVDNKWLAAAAAILSLALVYPTYLQAAANVLEWRWAVQALVHAGRHPLAESVGFNLPPLLEDEKQLWEALADLTHLGPDQEYLSVLNRFAKPSQTP
ncbi:MAG: hypothetical protein ACOYBY_10920 [Dermatophilaceae bacterium]